jgi:hypothetical protein
MQISSNQFGLVIAYLLPGFIGLAGIAPHVPLIAAWLERGSYAEASLGPPIYAILLATTIGMIASCFRWLLIDHIHHATGVTPPTWDDSRLEGRLAAFNYLVESHYRYYQFVANSLIAVSFAYLLNRWIGTPAVLGFATDLAALALCAVLFIVSRDALRKYYLRTGRLVGHVKKGSGELMYNGNHNEGAGDNPAKPRPAQKPENKPETSPKPKATKGKSTPPSK